MNALIRSEVEGSSFGIVYNITKLKNNGIELMVQMTFIFRGARVTNAVSALPFTTVKTGGAGLYS